MPLVIGLMSGTSADGVDAALVQIEGGARSIRLHLHAFHTLPFPSGMRDAILAASDPRTGTVDLLCRLNVALGEVFAEAALEVSRRASPRALPIGWVSDLCHVTTW
jgi:anhydro-N-acetylmuramic acid kinase